MGGFLMDFVKKLVANQHLKPLVMYRGRKKF